MARTSLQQFFYLVAASLRAAARRLVLVAALSALTHPARADPNDYILDLDFIQGEREVDLKIGAASQTPAGAPAAQAGAISWGAGIGARWLTEVYGQFANSVAPARGGGFDSLSWENLVRFAEPGEWPVDLGAALEVERPRVWASGWKITLGPMLQTDIDRVQVNVNALFVRVLDATPAQSSQIGYQYQLKYRADPALEFGLQGFRNAAAATARASAHADNVGPAIFGRYKLGKGRSIKYNAGFLIGTNSGAPQRTVRAQIDYEY